jgi:hypothetical protein
MSALADNHSPVTERIVDVALGHELIAHLDHQVGSAQRLLQIVLAQGAAIRARDVEEVVRYAGAMEVEMQRRVSIEETRTRLLDRAGAHLGVTPSSVTIEQLSTLLDGPTAELARERSTQLRGLLEEAKREHTLNRALMHQELAFLDHLLLVLDGDGSGAYQADGATRANANPAPTSNQRRVLDLEA